MPLNGVKYRNGSMPTSLSWKRRCERPMMNTIQAKLRRRSNERTTMISLSLNGELSNQVCTICARPTKTTTRSLISSAAKRLENLNHTKKTSLNSKKRLENSIHLEAESHS
jgi:hypothetical protein